MPNELQNEPSSKGESLAKGRCPILMLNGEPCGRPIHRVLIAVAGEGSVCLMHTRDTLKNPKEFQTELEYILSEAGDGIADFSRFVFPVPGCRGRQIAARCIFTRAMFTQDADFSQTTFAQDAEFFETTFTQGANFSYATFKGNVTFQNAEFTQNANFYGATFTQDAYLACARFMRDATFTDAKFAQKAHFPLATFGQYAGFTETTFAGMVDFRRARFAGAAHFRQTKFRQDTQSKAPEPSPLFSEAAFEEPESVTFYKTQLGRALFHNCDVSRMNFSDVAWRKRTNGKRMVLDEAVDLEHDGAEALLPLEGDPNPRNYRLVAELYQQLKKNYDDRRDYWTAGDFHYGEMEMKRLASDRSSKIRHWLRSNLGLVAWYKYASEYGESYVRPTWWLGLVLLVFMFIYPVAGLHLDASRSSAPVAVSVGEEKLSYWHPLQGSGDTRSIWRARRDLVGHSIVTTLYVAAFQKDLIYQPSYPWGRLLALAEVLFTSTLGALFLLAARRQFKR